jgi:hypothetical protein
MVQIGSHEKLFAVLAETPNKERNSALTRMTRVSVSWTGIKASVGVLALCVSSEAVEWSLAGARPVICI